MKRMKTDYFDVLLIHSIEKDEDIDSYPVEIGGVSWNCMRIGTKFFSYRLIRGDIRLLISSRDSEARIANTHLEIGSMSCWVPGYLKVFETINQMFNKESGLLGVSGQSNDMRNLSQLAQNGDKRAAKKMISELRQPNGAPALSRFSKPS